MRQKSLLKTMLLLCALIVGSGSVWAEESTWTWTAASGNLGTKASYDATLNGKAWTVTRSAVVYTGFTSECIQLGSSSGAETVTLSTSAFSGNVINSVDVVCASYQGKHNVSIKVGNTTYLAATATSSWTTTSVKSGTGTSQGDIEIKFTDGTRALYIKSITVKYEPAGTDPAIDVSANINITADDTYGEIPFTINNPVENTHLTATRDASDTWLSNVTVDETNGKVTFNCTVNEDTENSRVGTIHLVYGDNVATKDVTITQAAMPQKYTVTYESAQTGGTLTIKNGEAVVASGSKFPAGTILTIVATPNDTYKYRNWQYKAGENSWNTRTSNMTYEMPANNVEFRATFDETYPVNFYVNGQLSTTVRYAKDEDIAFGTPTAFGGYNFVGWAETAISGTSSDAPTFVTTAKMGTSEKDYYAVYAKTKEDEVSATFDASDISNLTKDPTDLKWTHNDTGITLSLTAGQHYTSGTPNTFTVTKGTSNYFTIAVPTGGRLTKIVTTISGTSYKINSVTIGTLSTSGTTQTITFTGNVSTVDCKATSNNQIRATKITVDAILSTILGYYTNLKESIIITSAEYATYCGFNAVDFSETGIKAYIATDGETSVTLTEITNGQVPANTPVVLYKASADGTAINVPVIASADPVVGTNDLQVVGEGGLTGEDYIFVLAKNPTIGFYLWDKTQTLNAGKIYLKGKDSYGARQFLPFNELTAIEGVKAQKVSEGDYYNLAGQKVSKPTKGLYIVNGKKILVK